jgi:hypothetical protein
MLEAVRTYETSVHFNKTPARCVRPIDLQGGGAGSESDRTQRLLETAEINVARKTAGRMLLDSVRTGDTRRLCRVGNISIWVMWRKSEWNDHINITTGHRIVRTATDK